MRKALVETATGKVVNVIILADGAKWDVPQGYTLVPAETDGSPGDTWSGGTFISPALIDSPALRKRMRSEKV